MARLQCPFVGSCMACLPRLHNGFESSFAVCSFVQAGFQVPDEFVPELVAHATQVRPSCQTDGAIVLWHMHRALFLEHSVVCLLCVWIRISGLVVVITPM
jgi:hypothetical protein